MAAKAPEQTGRDWRAAASLLLLSFLWSVDSLRADLFPHPPSIFVPHPETSLESGAVSFLLFAIVAASYAALRAAPWPRKRELWSAFVIGLGLFVVPAALVSLSGEWIAATTRVAIFSLAPIFALVLEPFLGGDAILSGMGGLVGALAAVAGTLCIFPLQIPGSLQAGASLGALIVAVFIVAAANCGAVRLARAYQATTIAPIAATTSLVAAAGLTAASAFIERPAWSWNGVVPQSAQAVIALPPLILLFWLMRRMTAARMTTRFVLAPFIAVLIGIALEQPSIGLRIWIGLLLIAAGSSWLLFVRDDRSDESSSMLNLHRH